MKPITKINTGTILIAALIICSKNFYYFFISNTDIFFSNQGLGLVWRLIFESYYFIFAAICLCVALLSMIRNEKPAAFYFIVMTLLLFPFYSLHHSYQAVFHPEFNLHESMAEKATEKMHWLRRSLVLLLPLVWLIMIFVAALVSGMMKRRGALGYKIIIGLVILSFAAVQILNINIWRALQETYYVTAWMPVYVKGIMISSLIIWLTTICNYLNANIVNRRIIDYVLCISLVFNLSCCFFLKHLMVDEHQAFTGMLMIAVTAVNILLLIMNKKYPRKEITVLLTMIQLLAGALQIAVYTGDFTYGFIWPELRELLAASIIAVRPALVTVMITVIAAQLFKQRTVASDE